MRIVPFSPLRSPPPSGAGAPAGAPTFRLAAAMTAAVAASAPSPVSSRAAGAVQRRRRAFAAGRGVLDELDTLKLAMLAGSGAGETTELASRLALLAQPSGDAALDDILAHVRLRAEVEIAKRNVARSQSEWPV